MIPVVLWLISIVLLLAMWFECRDPHVVVRIPELFRRIARLTGGVIYEDPALALRIQLTRMMVIITALTGAIIAVLERDRLRNAVGSLVNRASDPLNLSVFRIVVFWQILDICDFDFISRLATLPTGLQYPPQTSIPAVSFLRHFALWPVHTVSPALIGHAGVLMKWATIAALVGLFSRTSATVVCILFGFIWSRLQWYGKVDHYHHLFWFALLLATSPCGDVLSVDWIIGKVRGKQTPGPGQQYGRPLGFAMILMGVIYLFPGLWKTCRSGLDWALSDSPKFMMYQEWRLYGDWLPWFRYDQHPWMYHAGALGTMLFELSFLFLLLGRRSRYVAAAMGVSFHLMTNFTLNIGFESLRNCYTVFVDWARIIKRRVQIPTPSASFWQVGRATAAVGIILVAGNLWAGGMRAMDGWPLACYPPFDGLTPQYYRTLRMQLTFKDGTTKTIAPDDYRTLFRNRWSNLLQRILDTRDERDRSARLHLIWQVLATTDPLIANARHVQFSSVRTFLDPRRWSEPPDDKRLLYEADIEP